MGKTCKSCGSRNTIKSGTTMANPRKQRLFCKDCLRFFVMDAGEMEEGQEEEEEGKNAP